MSCVSLAFRQASIADIAAINALFWELDTDAINSQPQHFQRGGRAREYLSDLVSDENSDFLLAVFDGEIVGFSLLFSKETKDLSLLVPCKYAYIQDFVVKSTHRNRGVGSRLMDASKSWAKAHGAEYLRLSVLPDNENAQRFYSRHGLTRQMISMECPI